jgi:hypothetical protein
MGYHDWQHGWANCHPASTSDGGADGHALNFNATGGAADTKATRYTDGGDSLAHRIARSDVRIE